jgi:hypothetical protein
MEDEPIDFVQIKWQQIRFIESTQVVERENFLLRKKIQDLQQAKNSSMRKEFVAKFSNAFQSFVERSREDLIFVKASCMKQLNDAYSQKEKLKLAFRNMLSLLKTKDDKIKKLEEEKNLLTERNEILLSQTSSDSKSHESENQKLNAKLSKTLNELKEAEKNKNSIANNLKELSAKFDECALEKAKTELKNEKLEVVYFYFCFIFRFFSFFYFSFFFLFLHIVFILIYFIHLSALFYLFNKIYRFIFKLKIFFLSKIGT